MGRSSGGGAAGAGRGGRGGAAGAARRGGVGRGYGRAAHRTSRQCGRWRRACRRPSSRRRCSSPGPPCRSGSRTRPATVTGGDAQRGGKAERRSNAAAHLVDDGVSRAGRDLDHAVNDHLLLSVGEAAMHARAVAVISTAGCQSPLLTPPGMRLRQQRAGGRTVRAARSSQCPRRCAPAPPAAWGSWEACSLGPPSHQPPAGPCEVCVEQNMGRAVAVHAGGGREEAHLDDCTPLSHGNPLRHRE